MNVLSHVSGTLPPESHGYTTHEIEYLEKVDWLWHQLSQSQKTKIIYSVTDGTLSQGSCKHCLIAEAINAKAKTVANNHLFHRFIQLSNTVFYDGPSYDFLLQVKISLDDRKKLNDIYYARIGIREHQY